MKAGEQDVVGVVARRDLGNATNYYSPEIAELYTIEEVEERVVRTGTLLLMPLLTPVLHQCRR